jgi:predicted alpha/beta-fold hydrolase
MRSVAGLALEPCIPPFWARGGHAQTIWGHLLPSPRLAVEGERVEVRLADEDTLVGARFAGGERRVVYLFHGLGGSSDADYIRRATALCLKRGYTVYAMNHRGCGVGAGLARLPYHSGRAEDLAAVIACGRERHPQARHAAVGFSLSANVLLLLLGGQRGRTLPDYAVAFNAPIELDTCSRALTQPWNRIYDSRFVLRCRRDLVEKGIHGQYRVPANSTLREFDEIYVAPAGGFRDREEYYETCSAGRYVDRIQIPTAVIHAEDDPIIPGAVYRNAQFSSSCLVHLEKVGGHMGYVSARATPYGTIRWLDYALDRALAVLEET